MKLKMAFPLLLASTVVYGAHPLNKLKSLDNDGVANSALAALNSCQILAPAPFGSYVPPNVTLTVPARTVSTPPVTLNGPFPVTVPGQNIVVPATPVVIPGTVFLPPEPRLCTVSASGVASGSPPQPPGQSTFDLVLIVDFSTYRSNGTGGGCSLASGTLAFTKASGGNQEKLNMRHTGLLCDTGGIGSAKAYTATYYITGGTGKYPAAAGTGNMAASVDADETVIRLDGNVLFP